MTRIKMHISKVKLPFYPLCEVKCRLQNRVSTISENVGLSEDMLNLILGKTGNQLPVVIKKTKNNRIRIAWIGESFN